MTLKIKIISSSKVLIILLAACEAFRQPSYKPNFSRVKRQEGYVYNKPSIVFDLPPRPKTPSSTTSAGRTQSQMMYYAYPAVPASRPDTVNIGFSTSSTAAPTAAAGGYQTQGYGSSGGGGASSGTQGSYSETSISGGQGYGGGAPNIGGYNYGAPSTTASTTGGSISVSTVSGSTVGGNGGQQSSSGGYGGVQSTVGVQVSAASSPTGPTGYNYGTLSSTSSTVSSTPSTVGSTVFSTNAPKYLPPLGGGGTSVAIGGGGPSSLPTPGIPPDAYLLPVQQPSPSPTPVSPVPSLTSGYLPPNSPIPQVPSSSPSPIPSSPVTIPTVRTPTSDYLPPFSNPAPITGVVSTPAVTYLPPVF